MSQACKSINCNGHSLHEQDFCAFCEIQRQQTQQEQTSGLAAAKSLSERFPMYYKDVGDMTEIDVYAVHHLFNIQDPSGCLQQASRNILMSGSHPGGKPTYQEIREARDTLTRWLQLNPEVIDI